MAEKQILVTQVGSAIRRHKSQGDTLRALGLGRIGRSKQHRVDQSMLGMLKKVAHLVTVKEVGG